MIQHRELLYKSRIGWVVVRRNVGMVWINGSGFSDDAAAKVLRLIRAQPETAHERL
jgi:hypothetical protein